MNDMIRPDWWDAPIALGLVILGVWWLAALDELFAVHTAGRGWRLDAFWQPWRAGLRHLFKEFRPTERPDPYLWLAAPVLLVGLALASLTVMPLSPTWIGADLSVGVVFFTAMFALVLHFINVCRVRQLTVLSDSGRGILGPLDRGLAL